MKSAKKKYKLYKKLLGSNPQLGEFHSKLSGSNPKLSASDPQLSASNSQLSKSKQKFSTASASGSKLKSTKLDETQKQVHQVIDIANDNLIELMKRGGNLDLLNKRAENLETGAQQFKKTTIKIERKYWLQNFKWWIICITILLVLLGITAGKRMQSNEET